MAGGRGGEEVVYVFGGVCFTNRCRNNIFGTAAEIWFCLVLAERGGEFILELL